MPLANLKYMNAKELAKYYEKTRIKRNKARQKQRKDNLEHTRKLARGYAQKRRDKDKEAYRIYIQNYMNTWYKNNKDDWNKYQRDRRLKIKNGQWENRKKERKSHTKNIKPE